MNNEEKVVSYYKETLEKKIEWTFRLQSTLLTVASATFAVLVSLSNLSTNNACSFTIGGNMFKRTIHPFFVYNHIRESSNEQRDDTQRSKTGRRIYPL